MVVVESCCCAKEDFYSQVLSPAAFFLKTPLVPTVVASKDLLTRMGACSGCFNLDPSATFVFSSTFVLDPWQF